MLKHQAISIQGTDNIFIVLDQFCSKKTLKNKIMFWEKYDPVV